MSKVICDVCGTTYPETATQCPICGSAKTTATPTGSGQTPEGYTYVKGGRFSKSNVRKRNKKGKELERRPGRDKNPEEDSASGLLIAIVILLAIAIVAVLGYMVVNMLLSGNNADTGKPTEPTSSVVTDPTTSSEPTGVPCTGVSVARPSITFNAAGNAQLLSCSVTPANTTDVLSFSSSNPEVATVSDKGLVTAVSGGKAIITITCGEMKAQCEINCNFGDYSDVTEPTEPSAPTVSVPAGYELTLKYKEFTISKNYPAPVNVYVSNSTVKATDITWTVDDPAVATVNEKGVVSAVGKGTTTVRATYGDQTASCVVIVSFTPETPKENKYKISHTDVTLTVGESFSIFLTDSEGVNVQVEWTASEEGYVEIKDRNIKAIQSTSDVSGRYITISATIDDETYTCKIRIVAPTTEG